MFPDTYTEYLIFEEEIMQNKTKKKIIVYLAFLIVFSSVFYYLILRAGTLAGGWRGLRFRPDVDAWFFSHPDTIDF